MKLKENKIIDGLDSCEIENCEVCPYRGYYDCKRVLTHDAINFISGLKAEIERLNANMDAMVKEHKRLIVDAKAEAIKGFAEKLKDKIDDPRTFGDDSIVIEIIIDRINDLVKELTEEQK